MLSWWALALAVMYRVGAQVLPPTDQSSFTYPANGAGQAMPFPEYLQQLTGLTEWPAERPAVAPFTPNMAAAFNASGNPPFLDTVITVPLPGAFCQTFDDGPSEYSAQLLDYLAFVGQKTTYFEIGSNVVQNYLVTQREFSEGHEIACHTWSHPFLSTLSDESVYAELAWGCYAIHAAIGQFPKFFRPPYGDLNSRISGIAAQLGLQAVYWTDDSNDWQMVPSNPGDGRSPTKVVSDVSGFISSGGGAIVLEHDAWQETVWTGIQNSPLISIAGFINAPLGAVFGDAQRYQGTSLQWPIVDAAGFDGTQNPITGTQI